MRNTYRVLIAEDEQIESRALEYKIREMGETMELLSSVSDGWSLVKRAEKDQPDIIVVDVNMPGLNGLDAIELLRLKNLNPKIIIRTSYSDFSFIQKALQLGASDYLLKPGSQEELQKVFCRVCAQIDAERASKDEQAREHQAADNLYEIAAEKWIYSLFCAQEDKRCLQLLQENTPAAANGGAFVAWKCQTCDGIPISVGTRQAQLVTDAIRQYCPCISAEYHGTLYTLLCPKISADDEDPGKYILEIVNAVCRQAEGKGCRVSAGISTYKENPKGYAGALQEAKIAAAECSSHRISLFSYHYTGQGRSILRELSEKTAALLLAGKKEEASTLVSRQLQTELRSKDINAEILKPQAALFLLRLSELVLPPEGTGPAGWILWENYPEIRDSSDLLSWLENGISACYDTCFRKQNAYVEKALIYINENYNRDLALDEVAGVVGISPFYMSRLFKQENGISFTELLTDLRIRKAVAMMADRSKTLREICQETGFSSMPYFYRVFKKTTGITAGEMRQYLG